MSILLWVLVSLAAVLALLLLTAFLYSAWQSRRIERRFPPVGQFVEVEGLQMHYSDSGGDLPVLLLIHGASGNLREMQFALGQYLLDDYRVICVDRPGFGYSGRPQGAWPDLKHQARLMNGVLQQLGVSQATIGGHSYGGGVALAYGLCFPEQTQAILHLAGVSVSWRGGVANYYHWSQIPVLGKFFAYCCYLPLGQHFMEQSIQGIFAPDSVPADYSHEVAAALAIRPRAFLANAEDMVRLSDCLAAMEAEYEQLTMPLLLVSGGKDLIVPPKSGVGKFLPLLKKEGQNISQLAYPAAGHCPHYGKSRELVVALLNQRARFGLEDTDAA